MSKKKIAVALIVKNEEALLERALNSVVGCDSLWILDTGSFDRTVEIARLYTPNVFLDFVWIDSFCRAQNFLYDKLRGHPDADFILSLDADEYLDCPWEEVQKAADLAIDVVRVNMIAEGSTEDATLNFGFGRLFRNTPDIFWVADIHKHLNVPGEGEPIGDVRIVYGHSPAHNLDPDRSLRMLERAVEQQPDSARNLYYLGREYLYKKRPQDCIDTLLKYVKISEWDAEKAEAYLEIGQSYAVLGKYQEAADAFLQALKINTNFKEAILELASISEGENAIQWKRLAKTANNNGVLWDRVPAKSNRNKIIISPHCDDEVLFTGFTMIRERAHVIVVTDSYIQSERGDYGCDMETRRNESIAACAFLGCPVSFLGIRDTELTERVLRERLKNIEAETIYIPAYHKDGNPQHNLINKVCLEVFPKEKIEQYCSYNRTDLLIKGNYEIVPTEREKELKNKAMNFYVSQINLNSMASHFEYIRNKSEYLM